MACEVGIDKGTWALQLRSYSLFLSANQAMEMKRVNPFVGQTPARWRRRLREITRWLEDSKISPLDSGGLVGLTLC